MKTEEAISILKSWRITGDKSHEAVNMSIEALEKQIPMKIGPKVMDYLGRARPECGNCGEIVEDSMWSYCPWCGQGIGGE